MPAKRPHRRHTPPPPSDALLLLLASLAAAAAQPLSSPSAGPLAFLCPSLAASTRTLPDRYRQDDDGLWRKVGDFTLYGSSVSSSCKISSQAEEDNIATSEPSFDVQNLPPGWKPNPAVKRSSLVIALSVALAAAICIFMLGCLLFRRGRRGRRRNNVDLEMKMKRKRRKLQLTDTSSVETVLSVEKEQGLSQKIWARATARWIANVKYNARQRRGKRGILRSSQPNAAALPMQETAAVLTSQTDNYNVSQGDLATQSPSPPAAAMLPPAYEHDPDLRSVKSGSLSSISSPPSHLTRAAHVATDDKAVLAQMAGLVSAPPECDALASQGSAPAWQSEEEEILTARDSFCTMRSSDPSTSSTSFFPPPPSKGQFPASYFDDLYTPHDFRVDSESGPCAPPLEEEDIFPIMPSAPPIHLDVLQMEPSVPEWDDVSFHDMYITEGHRDLPLPHPTIPYLTSHNPPIQGPVNRDGELPSYQP